MDDPVAVSDCNFFDLTGFGKAVRCILGDQQTVLGQHRTGSEGGVREDFGYMKTAPGVR